jgi:dTDP-glucose 4,6-dehydratase
MNTWLVTGGAGFIGGNFVLRTLALHDAEIVNLDALTYAGNLDTLASVDGHSGHHFVHGNICDAGIVAKLLEKYRPAGVINFAAESHVDRSIDNPSEFIQTNVNGTLNLLECSLAYWRSLDAPAQRDFRFLQVSTDEVFGSLGSSGAFTETSPYAPNSPYAASKASADHLVRAFNRTYGLPTLITNCSNNYGPYQFPEKLIPLMILSGLEQKPLPMYGDGMQVRDWLFVHDHCDAIWTVLNGGEPGQVYAVGGDAEYTNRYVIQSLCELLDRKKPRPGGGCHDELISHVNDRPGHDRRYAIDFSKLKRELGWQPKVEFMAGMEQTIDWYLENDEWTQRVLDGSYRGERLGLGNPGSNTSGQ